MATLASALEIAKQYPIFPAYLTADNKKVAYIKDWPNRASQDPAQITEWWATWPAALVGIPTGVRSGIVVLDVDVPSKNGHKYDGFATLKAHGWEVPPTYNVTTHSGGKHLYFEYQVGLKNSAGELGLGLDIRADGGMVIAWNAEPGYQTDWVPVPITPLPHWLPDALARGVRQQVKGTSKDLIPEGSRNATLASMAGSMRRIGLKKEAILAALTSVNQERCQPPLPANEVDTIAASISKKPATAPLGPIVLKLSEKGNPLPVHYNALEVLAKDDRWKGCFGYDAFAERPMLLAPPPYEANSGLWLPREVADTDDIKTAIWLQDKIGLYVKPSCAADCIQTLTREHPYHPVKDYPVVSSASAALR